jgi:phosphatidate cytidylyltransferase
VFRERLMSSLILGPLVVSAFYLGELYFAGLILLISALGASEYRRLMGVAGIGIDVTFVPVSALVALSGYYRPSVFVAVLSGGAVLLLSIALVRNGGAPSAMYSLSGEMYIGGLLGSLFLLRGGPDGRNWAMFALLVTWATDVGAYLGGMAFGKHKMAPAISPGKSWEGAVSGILTAALGGGMLAYFMEFPVRFSVAGGAALGILAELGDLVESSLKRFAKVKDSGTVIPGHGGVLDRFDSLLFTGAGGLLMRTLHRLLL